MNKKQWEKISNNNNIVLNAKWGHISYNSNTEDTFKSSLAFILNMMGEDVSNGEETALYVKKDDIWHILTGDFRREYEAVFPNIKKCLEVYEKNKKFKSNWSTD